MGRALAGLTWDAIKGEKVPHARGMCQPGCQRRLTRSLRKVSQTLTGYAKKSRAATLAETGPGVPTDGVRAQLPLFECWLNPSPLILLLFLILSISLSFSLEPPAKAASLRRRLTLFPHLLFFPYQPRRQQSSVRPKANYPSGARHFCSPPLFLLCLFTSSSPTSLHVTNQSVFLNSGCTPWERRLNPIRYPRRADLRPSSSVRKEGNYSQTSPFRQNQSAIFAPRETAVVRISPSCQESDHKDLRMVAVAA